MPKLSTEDSTTTLNADGTYSTYVASAPVNYQDEGGDWVPISNELVPALDAGYAVENEANSYTVSMPHNPAVTPVKFETDAGWVTMKLAGSVDIEPDVDGTEATFMDLAASADEVTLTATNSGLKETITLDAAPTAPVSFRYTLSVSPGLTPVLTPTNQVEFRDETGEAQFNMPVPNMQDSASPEPAYTNDVVYSLTPRTPGWTLTVTPNTNWLSDPSRVYPVMIDPSIDKRDQKDCWIATDAPSANRCGTENTYAGLAAGSLRRILLDFGVDSIPAGATVNGATLFLFLEGNSTQGSDGATNFSIYQPNQRWSNAVSWNHSGITAWNGGNSGAVLSAAPVTLSGSTPAGWQSWNVTHTVRGWRDGSIDNRGFMVRSDNESRSKQVGFLSGTNSYFPDWRPILRIDYTDPIDPVVQQILDHSIAGTSLAQVVDVVNGVVASSGEDGSVPLTFDQAKQEVLAFLIETTQPDPPSTPLARTACQWSVQTDNNSVTVARAEVVKALARIPSVDATSPTFSGEVDGGTMTVTLWKGAAQPEITTSLNNSEHSLSALANASIAGAVNGQQEQNVETHLANVPVPQGLVTIGHLLEFGAILERGVPGGDCVRSGASGDSGIELTTPQGQLTIPSRAEAGSHPYPESTSVFRIRSFIPEAYANTRWVCGKFRGDNRDFTSYYEASNRTRESVFFNWPSQTMDLSLNVATTHRVAGYGRGAKAKTASADGIIFINPSISSTYGKVIIVQAVGNPLCSWAGSIQFNIFVEAWKNGAVRISGEKRKVPNYEAYYYPRSGAYGNTIYRKSHTFFVCLTLNCGDDDISAGLN